MLISSRGVGCMICGMSVDILAYADDIVLLAPSWKALQIMLDLLCKRCKLLDILRVILRKLYVLIFHVQIG